MFESFFWRDRRGFLNMFLITLSFLFTGMFIIYWLLTGKLPQEFFDLPLTHSLLVGNTFALVWRVFVRMFAVTQVHSFKQSLLVPVRWLIANFINVGATYSAWREYKRAKVLGLRPSWKKTQHELPADFGLEIT
jgi:adsorption protein B